MFSAGYTQASNTTAVKIAQALTRATVSRPHFPLRAAIILLAVIVIASAAMQARVERDQHAEVSRQLQAALNTSLALSEALRPIANVHEHGHGKAAQRRSVGMLDGQIQAIAVSGSNIGDASNRSSRLSRQLRSDWRDNVKPALEIALSHPDRRSAQREQTILSRERAVDSYSRAASYLGVLDASLARLDYLAREQASSSFGIFSAIEYTALFMLLLTVVMARRAWTSAESEPPRGESGPGLTASSPREETLDANALREETPSHVSASLTLLQTVLEGFVDNPESSQPYLLLLREIEELIGAKYSAIFIIKDADERAVPLVCTNAVEHEHLAGLLTAGSPAFKLAGEARVQTYRDPTRARTQIILVPLISAERLKKGFLLLEAGFERTLSTTEIALLDSLGKQLAAIICSAQRAQLNQRLALCEERAVIARELHDSLAQSLSYLKIQTSRLRSLLRSQRRQPALDFEDADAVLQELRVNLNLAYRQLRELITTFRLTMDGRTLGQALEDSVEEFEARSSVVFALDNRVPDSLLSVDQEMHVLQIVRECICNIVRHAQAKSADVSLNIDETGAVHVTVDDDGIGMEKPHSPDQHHGMVIVQQRVHGLGGDMRVLRSPTGGTRVRVSFAPPKSNAGAGQVNLLT